MFGEVARSPWSELRGGLVLGGEELWNKARRLVVDDQGDEEIRWRQQVQSHEVARLLQPLLARESDRRVAMWLRVRVGGERMTVVAKDYGYRDGSGVHRVLQRLEEKAQEDRALTRRLKSLAKKVSSVKS